jgi:hypothetical protein
VIRLNSDPSFINYLESFVLQTSSAGKLSNADGQIELLWTENGFKSASTYTSANQCSGINSASLVYSKFG